MKETIEYAGFWPRLFAYLIDVAVNVIIMVAAISAGAGEVQSYSLWWLGGYMLIIFYNIYFHFRWGATLGKLLLKIRVVNQSLASITLGQAFLRFSIWMFIGVVEGLMQIWVFYNYNGDFGVLEFMDRAKLVASNKPSYWGLVTAATQLWLVAELLTLIINKQHRTLHDFMAKTVVIKVGK